MVTDTERRDVARRLRGLHLNPWDDAACEIAQCAGIACCDSECHGSNETPECTMALCAHLADLIEPDDHFADNGEKVDRDALLALANELEEDACWEVQSPGVDNRAWMLKDVCDRIREACEEVRP